jgi:hypothetical protein
LRINLCERGRCVSVGCGGEGGQLRPSHHPTTHHHHHYITPTSHIATPRPDQSSAQRTMDTVGSVAASSASSSSPSESSSVSSRSGSKAVTLGPAHVGTGSPGQCRASPSFPTRSLHGRTATHKQHAQRKSQTVVRTRGRPCAPTATAAAVTACPQWNRHTIDLQSLGVRSNSEVCLQLGIRSLKGGQEPLQAT